MRVISVNAGRAREADWAGRSGRTAIEKRALDGPVAVREVGLAGDEHGGERDFLRDQAIYAYAREDYDWWRPRLGRDLRPGLFAENITLSGVDVSGALLGEQWRFGSALGVVTGPRIPCAVFRGWMDEERWVARFAEAGRTGAYLRVLEEGEVAAGDPVEIVHRPESGVTIAEAVRAHYGDAEVLRRILELPGHAPRWDRTAEKLAGTRAAATTM